MDTASRDEYPSHGFAGHISQITIANDVVRVSDQGFFSRQWRDIPLRTLSPRYLTTNSRRQFYGPAWCLAIFMSYAVAAPIFNALTASVIVWKTVVLGIFVLCFSGVLVWRLICYSNVEWIIFQTKTATQEFAFSRTGPDAAHVDDFVERLSQRIEEAQALNT